MLSTATRSTVIALAACAVVSAQAVHGDTSSGSLEEVVVTATKRALPIGEAAMSLSVITAQQLEAAAVAGIEDYWRLSPSVSFSDQGLTQSIAIRGLGNDVNSNVEPLAALYLGDIPITSPDGLFTYSPDFYLADVNRIEVLRGPQGTLFGASAMGGAIRILLADPDPESPARSIGGSFGSLAHGGEASEIDVMVNQPLSESTAVRMVAYYRNRDGYIDDVFQGRADINDREDMGVRFSLSAMLGDNLSILARILHQETEGGGFNYVMETGIPLLGVTTPGDYDTARLVNEFRDEESTVTSLRLEYEFAQATLTSVSAYLDFDVGLQFDVSNLVEFANPGRSPVQYNQKAFTQELRLAGTSGSMDWLVGAYYLDQEVPRTDQILSPGLAAVFPFLPPDFPELVFDVRQDSDRREYAAFADLSWHLTDRLSLNAGARWYDITKRSTTLTTALLQGVVNSQTEQAYDETGVTPKLGISWTLSRGMLYASAAQGFRAGGGNAPFTVAVCGAPESYDSDELWTYEVGYRGEFGNGRVQLNAAAYTTNWDGAQQKVDLPDCSNIFIDNVGEVRSTGFEFETTALLKAYWELRATIGLNNSELAEDSSLAPKGTDIPLIPELTATLSSNWTFPIGDRYEARLSAEAQHTGASNSNLIPEFSESQSAYTLVHLRLGVRHDNWSLTLFANNVFDEQGVFASRPPSPLGAGGGFITTAPRSVGVRARYAF